MTDRTLVAPASEGALGTAARHISGSVTWNIVNLVRQSAGDDGVDLLLEKAASDRTVEELEDDSTWVSFDEGRRLFDAATVVLDDPRALRRVGAAIARRDMTSEVAELLRSLGSPGAVLRHIDQVVPKFCTVVRMEAVEIGEHTAVLAASSLPDFPRFGLLCDFTAGLLGQASLPFDLPPAEVVEEECELRGDDRCLFRVTWESDVSLTGNAEHRLAALEADTAILAARFKTFQETAADLVAVEDVASVLARITERAGLALRAPRHLLVVRPTADSAVTVHHQGCAPEEIDLLVREVMDDVPDEHSGSRLIVDVASVRRHYGRLAAIYDDGARFFSSERAVLEGYGRLAAAALDTATALEESRQETETAQALLDLARGLAGIGRRHEMADRLAKSVPSVTGCNAAVVALWDSDAGRLEMLGLQGLRPAAEQMLGSMTVVPSDAPVLNEMLTSPGPMFLDAATSDPFVERMLCIGDMKRVGIAPMVAGDQLLGVVCALFDERGTTPNARLLARLSGLADIAATAIQNSLLIEHMRHQALYDSITGLPNKRLLEDRVASALAHARRTGEGFTLLFLDLDRFKNVNDTLGHAAGDLLLQQVGERFRSTMREEDTVARLGGDEFALLLPRVDRPELAKALTERLYEALQLPFEVNGQRVFITSSIGIAAAPVDGEDYDSLLKHADMAMYQAKEQGRNRYGFYSPTLHANLADRLKLESDLHLAIQNDELFLEYQPQVSLADNRIVGVEALVRWAHPELGLLLPDRFVPLAEESGLIVDVDAWVVATACRQARSWQQSGLSIRMAVNLANRDLRDATLVARIAAALAKNRLAPRLLELEVTERVVDSGSDELLSTLRELKGLGVALAIDDFGTGNSGLGRLRTFPIDTLKIDRSFVQEVAAGDTAPLLAAMVSLAHDLGMSVVAEGVETEEQAAFLSGRGCELAQGYYFSRPVSADAIVELARERQPQIG